MTKAQLLIGAALACWAGRGAVAQGPAEWDPDRVVATRQGLEGLKSRLLLAAQSPAYSPRLRAQASSEAAAIDRRLALGDFQPGDRVYLAVEGEAGFPDTFTVTPARELSLPTIGAIPLAGVLRSDIEPYVTKYVATFVRSPTVHAQPLIAVSVLGKVVTPGFYTVPAGMALTQLLSQAKGPTPDADLTKITIEREGRVIWEGPALQRAITEGRTLEQLGLRAGDRVMVPGGKTDVFVAVQTVSYALGIPLTLYTLVRLFSGK